MVNITKDKTANKYSVRFHTSNNIIYGNDRSRYKSRQAYTWGGVKH